MDITTVLVEKYDGAQWNLINNDYNQLSWEDINVISKPSLEELEQKWQEIQDEKPMKLIREQRDTLLKKTDVYSLPDFPHVSQEMRQAWLDYRQALRDLPTNTEDPENPNWPTPPNA
jgi:hypothetical protein